MDLVQENVAITKEIFSEIVKYNQSAIIIVISNPVDVLTALIREVTGFPRKRVIGTGTLLDTARLVGSISYLLDISPSAISALMLGEHGNTSCVIWSAVRILGMSLKDYFAIDTNSEATVQEERLSDFVRSVGARIIGAKGYTAYGVAAAAAKVTAAIITDSHNIFPLSVQLNGEYGQERIAFSVPCVIGRDGIIQTIQMKFTDDEAEALKKSAEAIRKVTAPVLGF